MPIPATPLRRGDRGAAVADLHRTLEAMSRPIEPSERAAMTFGGATEDVLRELQAQSAIEVTGVFDDATRAVIVAYLADVGPYVVFGALTDADGLPIEGATVFAVDVDLRRTEVLGQTTSDVVGGFEVRYTASQFTRAEKTSADLLVRAVRGDDAVVESGVTFNAPAELRIDLVAAGRHAPPELDRLHKALAPLLDGASPDELGPPDAAFLAGETGLPVEAWRAYIRARALVLQSGVPLTAHFAWQRTGQPPTWDGLLATPLSTLRIAALDAVDRNLVPRGLRDELDAILAMIPSTERDTLVGALEVAAVPADIASALIGRLDGVATVSDRALGDLVAADTISAEVAERIGLAASLHRLLGGDLAAAKAVVEAGHPALPDQQLRAARDLAVLAPVDWMRAFERAGVAPPAGTTLASHARTRAIAATRAFPEVAFRHHATRAPDELAAHLERLAPVLRKHKDLLDHDLAAIDGLSERERDGLRLAHAEIRALVHAHPGLALREVVMKGGAEAASTIATRLGWVAGVLARNPDAKLTELDFFPDSVDLGRLDFGDLTLEQRNIVLADFRAQRRMDAVTGDAVRRQELMTAGFSSASAIAGAPIALLVERTGIALAEMKLIQGEALYLANIAALHWFGIYDHTRDSKTTPVRVIPSREQFFYPLAGYAQLLNDQPWCECEECQSVLSPAAYFVDTLHYIERFILAGSFATRPTHPLHLEQRRPDLWDLPLSCASSKDVVPTLDLVNELLEKYIRDAVPLPAGTDVFAHLAEQEASLRQPFTLPIEQIDTLLGHFQLSRHAIARAMAAPRDTTARARLGLSPRAYALVTTERIDPPYLRRMFGIAGTVAQPDVELGAVEVAALVAATGVEHDVLAAALTSAFVAAGTPGPAVAVVFGKRDGTDVQNTTEIVNHLTLRRLDRLHRFLRLWRALPWSIVELDYTLGRLAATGAAPQLTADTPAAPGTLERIAALLELQDAWSIPVDQVLAITDGFPTIGLRGDEPLFDRLFNPTGFAEPDGRWTEQTTGRFTHPTWSSIGTAGAAAPNDNTHARLLAGLQLDDAELVALIAGISADPALDYRAGTATASESISFGRAAVASLYRHARVRALLGISVEDFVGLLVLPGDGGQSIGYLRDVADVQRLAELAAWRAASGLAVRELAYLVTGLRRPSDVPDPEMLARELPAAVAAAADDATRASIAAGATPLALLDLGLAGQLDRSPDEIALLRACYAVPSAASVAAIVRALEPGATGADVVELAAYVAQLVRFHRLFAGPAFALDGLGFVRHQRATFFGAAPAAGAAEVVTLDVIRRVDAYRTLVTAAAERPLTASARIAAIRAVVTGAPSDAQRAAALAADDVIVAGLVPHLALSGEPFADLALVAATVALATTLGTSAETFARMLDESDPAAVFGQLARAAGDVLGAFRAKYADPRALRDKLEPYEDVLRGRRRDGLVDYLVTRWPTPFASADRLTEYFLMDVLVGGCARTSRVVAATGSLQLYVHRVLMNLERSADWTETADIGVFARFSDGKRRDEWQWRKYYRVWQANRKVFLYPENYLEPELRDDKTPLFEELEDALLGGELTKQDINDAYSQYLTGFDGLSRLQIAGAYRDEDGKTLHLFGVTQDDAPIYYYRSIDESRVTKQTPVPVCSPWHKVPLSIPVRKVSPFLFEQRLYVFWVETSTRSISSFTGGSSSFTGYRHSVRVRYSTLRLDGTWAAPQLVRFQDRGGISDVRIVEDPVDVSEKQTWQTYYDFLEVDLGPRTDERDAASAAIDPAKEWLAAKRADRKARERDFENHPPLELVGLGLKAIALAVAEGAENRAREALRAAEDRFAVAKARLADLERQLAEVEEKINHSPAHARWDRSLRNHHDALDSYRPAGWAWDRVYPELYTPTPADQIPGVTTPSALRLTLVPYGNQAPPPAVMPIRPGNFDPVTGVLREPDAVELTVALNPRTLNFSGGNLQPVDMHGQAYAGTRTVLDAYLLHAANVVTGAPVAVAPPTAEVQVVMGLPDSIIVEHEGDAVWMRRAPTDYGGTRLGTTLTRSLQRQFMLDGPTSLLDAAFQRRLAEGGEIRSRISPVIGQSSPGRQSPFHREHLWLPYYRETFLHIPWLIADYQNTEQDYAASQRWYHSMFDPTAADGGPWRMYELTEPEKMKTPLRELLVSRAALEAYRRDPFSPHAIARTRMSAYAKSIVMKYIDNLLDWGDSLFAQFTMESINEATMLYIMARDILGPRPPMLGSCGAGGATRTYRAIRGGLTDVSDLLVELETPPAVTAMTATGFVYAIPEGVAFGAPTLARRQASMTAASHVAPRAPRFAAAFGIRGVPGDPGAGADEPTDDFAAPVVFSVGGPATPAALAQLGSGHTLWTTTSGTPLAALGEGTIGGLEPAGAGFTVLGTDGDTPVIPGAGIIDYVQGYGPDAVGTQFGDPFDLLDELHEKYGIDPLNVTHGLGDVEHRYADPHLRDRFENFHADPIAVVPPKDTVFCIPPNKELLGYWDRVEDRLWKVRNCMDLSGARRRPELFAPELDPAMLVRMTAAGLTVDDILGMAAGKAPAYRFTYLVEKAKQHAGTVQGFGAQLLAALEKGDAEELNQLRSVHEQNLLSLRGKLATLEIDAAEETLASLRAQREAVEYRRQHFLALRAVGSLPQERTQQELQKSAGSFRTAAGIAQTVASILTVIPDFGAPTAMKFGGSQLGAAGRAVGEGLGNVAAFLDTGAALAGVAGSIRRRDEEWLHQQETARRELAQIDRSIAAAEIRRDLATRSLEVHERTVTQAEEMFAFFRDRFSSVDRYRLLVKDLRRLYKVAFDSALRLAQLAEQAYRTEREDDDPSADNDALAGGYWDAGNAGLLAGEKLLADLQRLERQYIARNRRKLELEHSFSLAQLAPDHLDELRRTGECEFSIPEWFFDLSYPGHYRRRIKSVRISMPCVTGPYVNVGATLRLERSTIRHSAPEGAEAFAAAAPVLHGDTPMIATSKAQLDGGVFELSFRDERYVPFEGAGAISEWKLTLPRTLRTFDYDTISDVIVHLQYTADHSTELAHRWEEATTGLLEVLRGDDAAGRPPIVRRISLRGDLPDVFHRLVHSPVGTEVTFALDERHFAGFLSGQRLTAKTATLSLVTRLANAAGAQLAIANKPSTAGATPTYATVAAGPVSGTGALHEVSFGSVLKAPPTPDVGIVAAVGGGYLLKFAAAGALAPAATPTAIDPKNVHDVVLELQCRIAPAT
jgi:hypothetical protein